MSFALEMADSELRDVVAEGAAVRLRFELALSLANGTQLVVRGQALVASAAEGARLTPDLSC